MNKLEERMLRAKQLLGESDFNKVKDNPEELRKAVHQKMVEGMFPPMSAEEASFYFHILERETPMPLGSERDSEQFKSLPTSSFFLYNVIDPLKSANKCGIPHLLGCRQPSLNVPRRVSGSSKPRCLYRLAVVDVR